MGPEAVHHRVVEAGTDGSKEGDSPDVVEGDLQKLIQRAPWLIRPDWSVITQNQALKTFRDRFAKFWHDRTGQDIEVAIMFESKQPDFTLVHIGQKLHIVEMKKPKHAFANKDYERLQNYLEAFEQFFADNRDLVSAFPDGWMVDLVADSVNITDITSSEPSRRRRATARSSGSLGTTSLAMQSLPTRSSSRRMTRPSRTGMRQRLIPTHDPPVYEC